jgi:predicted ATPase
VFVRRLTVHNFMIHRKTTLELFPMTVFVGPNNSGKSSLFDALLNLSRVCSDPITGAFPTGPYSYRSRHHNGDESDEPIGFETEISQTPDDNESLVYDVAYRQISWSAGQATYEIIHERLFELPAGDVLYDRQTGETTLGPAFQEFLDGQTTFFAAVRTAYFDRKLGREGLLGHVASNISRFGKYRLDHTLLSKPSPIPEVLGQAGARLPTPRMRYSGEGLAGVLYFLDRTRDRRMDAIIDRIASAVDGFAGFEFNAVPNDFVVFSARFSDSRGLVEAPNLSAGTLSLIGWLTLLMRGDRQPLMMLEEPELGLTPRSTQAVYAAAREVVTSPGESTQLLISSHSPRVLSWAATDCGMDHVFVVDPEEGAANVLNYETLLKRPDIGIDFTRAMSVETANQVMHGF